MSIFFASGNISDSQQSENQQVVLNQKVKPTYNFGDDNDYDNNDKKRTVQTQKDKKWNIIKTLSIKITNQLNNQDFQKVWQNLQQLLKQIQKASKVIEKQGKYPSVFLKTLKKVDDDITAYTTSGKKKPNNKNAATAFNTMRQKLKNKIIPEFQDELKKFAQNEEGYSSGQEEAFESQSSSQSESDSQDEDRGNWRSEDVMIRRKYFLKKDKKDGRDSGKQSKDETDEKPQAKPEVRKQQQKKKEPKFNLTNIHQKKKIQIKSVKQAQIKMKNLIGGFHKCTTKDQREEYLDELDEIVKQSQKYKDFQKLSFMLVDIPIRIEVYRQMKLTHFMRDQWNTIFNHIEIIYNIFRESEEEDLLENVQIFSENNSEQKITTGQQQTIYKALQAFLIIIESQLRKSFIFIGKSDVEYPQRLQDLIKILDFMYRVSRDMSFHDDLARQTTEVSFKVLENMYFMSSNFMNKIKSGTQQQLRFTQLSDENVLHQYCEHILKSGIEQYTTKTILYKVFNHAVNQREKARQLLIMSNIPETINQCDYYTQAIFNRCIVQIGINSFLFGKYFEVQQSLSQICGYGKNRDQTRQIIRQFLAQGYSRTLIQRQIPRNKILPYYLHLNVELIESLELIASMILEIPYTLTQGGKISAKTFKKVYFEYERSHFIAQPLNHRDLIYAASCQLKQGNWKQCYNRLLQLQVWKQIENVEFAQKNMLQIIKEFSLKCYLLANKKCFKSISLENMAIKFEMEDRIIRKLISKWIYSRDIQGSINQKGFLILAQKKHSQMQKLCQNLYNKLQDIRKSHQQIMEQRFSVPHEADEQQGEKDTRLNRRFNLAMNERLKSILSRRN